MIGIIGAMDVEIQGLVSAMEISEAKTISSIKFYKGILEGKETVIAKCNPGKVNAAICAQTMILIYGIDALINTGVAGGLSKNLNICDVAIAENVVQHDMDTTPLGDPAGLISGLDLVKIPADKKIALLLTECASGCDNTNVEAGTIASGDQFLNSSDVKDRIVSLFGAIAGEMEGASIGHVAYTNGVPFGVLRVISDNADGDSDMDFPHFCALAAEKSIKICREFVKKF
ncbi:MAG: 5'-methylthioadenosine/adenosylhomocysteine nucleosidase [Clostridia bacterium]|nr:5'-methylthioadenosine/adenosylhomocysteine nucleosidase [Clostridia bacterium]